MIINLLEKVHNHIELRHFSNALNNVAVEDLNLFYHHTFKLIKQCLISCFDFIELFNRLKFN